MSNKKVQQKSPTKKSNKKVQQKVQQTVACRMGKREHDLLVI